jgi:diamine N-acetyltransferase
MDVALAEITRDTVRAVCHLAVHEHQRNLIAPAATTVAEAHYYAPGALLRAITADGEPVGVLWVQVDEPKPYLVRFMVEAGAQGKGIGRRAFALLQEELRAGGHRELEVSWVPADDGAEGFWLKCGFSLTGRVHEGETVGHMNL